MASDQMQLLRYRADAVPGRAVLWDIRWPGRRRASENGPMEHLSRQRLEAGLGQIRDSPRDGGRIVLVVRRPAVGVRELPGEVMLDAVAGLAGDNWLARGSRSTPDRSADPQRQVTVMNARVAELVAGGTDRMPLAGDQLYIDLDLSVDNLPAGSFLAVGRAVLQVSDAPHLGCAKFVERFGAEAMRFVNSRVGRNLRLRGMNTRVVHPGIVRRGDIATRSRAAAGQPGDCPQIPDRHPEINPAAPAELNNRRVDASGLPALSRPACSMTR
jgi:MOSC domain-containing protein YiiM